MNRLRSLIISFFVILFCVNSFAQNLEEIQELKAQLLLASSDSTKVELYGKLADSFWDSESDSSFYYLTKKIELASKTNNQSEFASGNEWLGFWLMKNGKYSASIKYLDTSLQKFKELDDKESIAYVYSGLGYAHLSTYETNKAISYYLKALKMFQEMNNDDGLSELYIEIGNLFYDQKNYDEAKCYFEDALVIMERMEDSLGIATVYTNLGNVVSDDGDYELGIDYYNKSNEISKVENDDYGLAVNYNNLGDTYIRLEKFDEAQNYFLKAHNAMGDYHDAELEAIIYLGSGEAYLLDGKYYQAIENLEKSLSISKDLSDLETQSENYMFLAQSYSKLKKYAKANDLYMRYDAIKRQLEEIENERKISLFKTMNELEESYFTIDNLAAERELALSKYLTEKKISFALIIAILVFSVLCIVLINQQSTKKQAYNLLEYKNFLIKKMNQENTNQKKDLEELNETKDKFFSIIGHDLKNPFNSIKGFSELLIDNFDEYDKEKQMKFLKIIKDSSLRASNLLNNLLLWANNQSGNIHFEPVKIQLVNQVADAVALVKIQAVNKDIEISTNIDPDIYVKADENMLNTILRNLISNAIKFTQNGGKVDIFTRVDKELITVFVRDTGIGISTEYQNKLFNLQDKSTSVGTNNEQGSGLGLILCQDFIKQNGGELHVQSKVNKGSTFYFTIPVYKSESNKKAVLRFKTA